MDPHRPAMTLNFSTAVQSIMTLNCEHMDRGLLPTEGEIAIPTFSAGNQLGAYYPQRERLPFSSFARDTLGRSIRKPVYEGDQKFQSSSKHNDTKFHFSTPYRHQRTGEAHQSLLPSPSRGELVDLLPTYLPANLPGSPPSAWPKIQGIQQQRGHHKGRFLRRGRRSIIRDLHRSPETASHLPIQPPEAQNDVALRHREDAEEDRQQNSIGMVATRIDFINIQRLGQRDRGSVEISL